MPVIYEIVGNVVKDPIVSIETLGTENHPKLYDVTVPSTLNFITMNGVAAMLRPRLGISEN